MGWGAPLRWPTSMGEGDDGVEPEARAEALRKHSEGRELAPRPGRRVQAVDVHDQVRLVPVVGAARPAEGAREYQMGFHFI